MGTTSFIDEVLDIFSSLDSAGKQMLIDYASQLVAEQRIERGSESCLEQTATA
jgi:hypothetical protein